MRIALDEKTARKSGGAKETVMNYAPNDGKIG